MPKKPAARPPTNELALHLKGSVSPDIFKKAVLGFVRALTSFTGSVHGSSAAIRWVVDTYKGSVGVKSRPAQNDPESIEKAPAVLKEINRCVAALEAPVAEFDYRWPRAGLEGLKEIADVEGPDLVVSLGVNGSRFHLRGAFSARVSECMRDLIEDYGTIEGVLKEIAERKEGLRAQIQDEVTGLLVGCSYNEDLYPDMLAAMRRRVSLTGRITYTSEGTPRSIHVTRVFRFPDSSDLPTYMDVKGII